jgi:N-acetylglutamate synthase-like GNAT family acetyltransferase
MGIGEMVAYPSDATDGFQPPLILASESNQRQIAMSARIRICTKGDSQILAEAIRKSFQDVAERFGLTQENAPRHPSNCTADWIRKDMERSVTYFAIENKNHVVGCVAYEQANSEVCYLERLAVLPNHRRRGFGKALVERVVSEAKHLGVNYVTIGIIAEHTELKDWYKGMGFVEGESKRFPDLPFGVTVMSYEISRSCRQYATSDVVERVSDLCR